MSMGRDAPAAVHVSTAGACRYLPNWLEALVPAAVECGFDADAAGDEAARALMANHPRVRRVRPKGARDWNEMLKLRTR